MLEVLELELDAVLAGGAVSSSSTDVTIVNGGSRFMARRCAARAAALLSSVSRDCECDCDTAGAGAGAGALSGVR